MPTHNLEKDIAVDQDSSSLSTQLNRQDASSGGTQEPDADSASTTKASIGMASNRTQSTSTILPNEDGRARHVGPPGPTAKSGKHQSQDGLLQIPAEGNPARRPIETSIWDWDTPLESVGESSSYYFEPQGELLQEQREQRQMRTDFSIPHAVSSSNINWPFPPSATGSGTNDGFAVPKRPSDRPPSILGNKRKSSDRDNGVTGRQPDQKRSSRVMCDSTEEEGSPTGGAPPALSTRSQSGPPQRLRSATDTSESRPRPSVTDIEAARPHGATSGGPRRTLTDPAIPMVLPARKVFPIQIGDKLFRLSGASISSDGE